MRSLSRERDEGWGRTRSSWLWELMSSFQQPSPGGTAPYGVLMNNPTLISGSDNLSQAICAISAFWAVSSCVPEAERRRAVSPVAKSS